MFDGAVHCDSEDEEVTISKYNPAEDKQIT
jgi:hypothetical protein